MQEFSICSGFVYPEEDTAVRMVLTYQEIGEPNINNMRV